MKILTIAGNIIATIGMVIMLGEAFSFTSRSTFSIAEASLAAAVWGRAATFAILLLIGVVAYATVSRQEDVIAIRNELREVQNRLGAVHSVLATIHAVSVTTPVATPAAQEAPAVLALPPAPSTLRPKVPSPTWSSGDMSYRGIAYSVNADYSVSATVNGKLETWPSLADFRSWIDLSLGPETGP